MRPSPSSPWRRRLLAALIGALASFLLVEVGLRVLLLSDSPAIARVAKPLRKTRDWANNRNDDLFWKLTFLWSKPERRHPLPNTPDPLVGWLGKGLTASTYEHQHARRLESRRPVLLYGDSFAQGVTEPKGRFEMLFNQSVLGDSHGLINYGVGGYGVDQAYLLCKNSVELFAEQKPVVIFSILIDDDLDRAVLSLRGWPRPKLRVEDGELTVTPPETNDTQAYIEAHPPSALSWTWQYLANSPNVLPQPTRARMREESESNLEKQELFRAMMVDLKADLDARGVEWFVLIFVGQEALVSPRPRSWREPAVLRTLKQLEIPFVHTRPDLYACMNENGLKPNDLFILRGRGRNHLNERGNLAVIQTMLRGLRGECDPYEYVAGKLEEPSGPPGAKVKPAR